MGEPQRRKGDETVSLFALPQEWISSITTLSASFKGVDPEEHSDHITSKSAVKDESAEGHKATTSCSLCGGLLFPNVEDMKTHYKSDWHRYNIKRQIRSQKAVTEDEFEELAEVSSIEASDTEHEDTDVTAHGTPKAGSPLAILSVPDANKAILVYKQVLGTKQQFSRMSDDVGFLVDNVRKHQVAGKRETYWTLLMLGAGHFAGTVIDCRTGKALVHKTFHRYTTRRKQGGAQSANDQSKGAANSAGAGLRRYNEQALHKEVRELLTSWKDYIDKSDLIFVRAPGASRKTLFFDDGIDQQDERVRSFPFTTRRPTFGELQRCFAELSTLRVRPLDELLNEESAEVKPQKALPKQSTPKVRSSAIKEQASDETIEEFPLSSEMKKVIDLCKRGKPEPLKSVLQAHRELDLTVRLPEDMGTSLLHIATSGGSTEIVDLLLSMGLDPTVATDKKKLRPYELATSKDVRDTFRRFVYRNPNKWDWKESRIPGPLTPEMEQQQKEKEAAKKKKQKEKQKAYKAAKETAEPESPPSPPPITVTASKSKKSGITKLTTTERQATGMTPEQRMRLDREKRAAAAEARIRAQQNQCAACGKSLAGIMPFDKYQFRYCSLICVGKHQILST
ncbi:hypothetical protein BC832DRAFT_588221 [Gaertneriomyces semiglobifer]|nr:hypothetical protein BC832DRAFT_588221 [Gaertneriomyces semiglobifer]